MRLLNSCRWVVAIVSALALFVLSDPDNARCAGDELSALLIVGGSGGLTDPTGDWGQVYSTGGHATLGLSIDIPKWPMRGRVRGIYFRVNEPGGFLGQPRREGHLEGRGAISELVVVPNWRHTLAPYLFGGYGVVSLTFRHAEFGAGAFDFETRDTDDIFSVGGGLEWRIHDLALGIGGEYLRVASNLGPEFLQLAITAMYAFPL